jgi:hypothetical protein
MYSSTFFWQDLALQGLYSAAAATQLVALPEANLKQHIALIALATTIFFCGLVAGFPRPLWPTV